MVTLPIIVRGDTFESLWPALATRHEIRPVVTASVEEISCDPRALPPLLVAAGAEHEIEDDLRSLRAAGVTGTIVLGTEADHRYAVELLRAGAGEYFAIPADLDLLDSAIATLVTHIRNTTEHRRPTDIARARFDFREIIGRSPAIQTTLDRASHIIPYDRTSVLITGETGTGKELIARAIHVNGPRASGAFVDINCAAIPANLLESELFGYERGAFTDARSAKPGLFEAANGGTLFLDEIGHLPVTVQGKLLRAIEDKRIRRLGSLETREIDVRIIAATHVNLPQKVAEEEFREDLYYRLAVVPLHLPPLRERGEDILLIAEHFFHRLAEQYGMPVPRIDEPFRRALLTHTWPGNVRELRNAIERAILLGGEPLDPTDLFPEGQKKTVSTDRSGLPFPATLDLIQREAARQMVEYFDGNKSAAAAALEISRSRLYRLLAEPEPTYPQNRS